MIGSNIGDLEMSDQGNEVLLDDSAVTFVDTFYYVPLSIVTAEPTGEPVGQP